MVEAFKAAPGRGGRAGPQDPGPGRRRPGGVRGPARHHPDHDLAWPPGRSWRAAPTRPRRRGPTTEAPPTTSWTPARPGGKPDRDATRRPSHGATLPATMAQSPPWGPPDPHTRVGPTGGRRASVVAPTAATPIGAPGPRLRRGVGARPRPGTDDPAKVACCRGPVRAPHVGRRRLRHLVCSADDRATLVDWTRGRRHPAGAVHRRAALGVVLLHGRRRRRAGVVAGPVQPQRGSGRGHPARGVGRGGRPSPGHRLRARDGPPGQPARHRVRRVLGRRQGRPAEPSRRSRHHDRADHRPRRHRRPPSSTAATTVPPTTVATTVPHAASARRPVAGTSPSSAAMPGRTDGGCAPTR